jgi:methylphosphotriester-DNA--protein-cysteine methyltransferase
VAADPAVGVVFEGDRVVLGEFHCWPGDPRWARENCAEGHFVVFPGTSVVIEHGGRPVVATPNHVMFYNPDQHYRRRLLHPRGDHCAFLLVQSELLGEVAPRLTEARFPVSHGPLEPSTYLLHRLLLRALVGRSADRLLVEETLCRLLAEALASGLRLPAPGRCERRSTAASHAELVEATKELLAGRLGDRLTLREIARSVHSSPFHLARVFRARTGFSIHGYRNQLRLRTSLERLFEPETDLALLGRDLGYSSHSHFTDSFHRAFGRPPSVVRRAGRTAEVAELRTILEAPLAAAS